MGIKVGVFFGGKSAEHEVSVISAIQALRNFDRAKYDVVPVYIAKDGNMYGGDCVGNIKEYKDIPALLKKSVRITGVVDNGKFTLVRHPRKLFGSSVHSEIDVAFPITHGTNVEDGALQGYFKTMSVPFVGSDVTASSLGMDKYVTKAVLQYNGIPVLHCVRMTAKQFYKNTKGILSGIEEKIPYPVIVKPVNLGSSIGIKKAVNAEELEEGLEAAFQYSSEALVERAVPNLLEINCAVLGDMESAIASECEEPLSAHDFLNYSDKYVSGGKTGGKGLSSAKRIIPAEISMKMRDTIRALAIKAFQALRCCGVARVDFLIDSESGEIWVNEINTIPGSLSFYLWDSTGLPYAELLDRLIELAMKREREISAFSYSFDINLLADFAPAGLKSGAKN